MTGLALQLLGPFNALRSGAPLAAALGTKAQALLAYLAVEPARAHQRAAIAALLWPEQPLSAALRNLAQAIARLRALLGEQATPLVSTRDTIAWQPHVAEVDVMLFRRLADSAAASDLADAVALYRGEFMAGFSLAGCADFEEWLLLTREQLVQQALGVLQRLADARLAAGEYVAAAEATRRYVALDPWHEPAHRQLMRTLAATGDRAAAMAAYARCRQILHDDLGIEPEAETIALAAQIQQETALPPVTAIRSGGVSSPASAPPALQPAQPALPAPVSSLLGREDELARLAAYYGGATRLVTIVGAGGAGKTRLALAAAWDLRPRFADQIWWADLSGIQPAQDPAIMRATLSSAVASAAGIKLGGRAAPVAELAAALRAQRALLVLDNCEHLPEVASVVQAVLGAAPELRILATSRSLLGLTEETLLRLDGLPVPATGAPDPTAYAGVQLFLERAARRFGRWEPDAATIADVAQLCRLLDGLPLGIELAARWAGHYPPGALAAAIQADVDLLDDRGQDRPSRHRSLRAVFDYTWRLLDDAERAALPQLAVFQGRFDREAAQTIAGVQVATLAALADKSLVRSVGSGRYSMHELLRQFAAEELRALGAEAELRARHAAYYAALAERAGAELAGPQQARRLVQLDGALDNLRAALGWADTRGDETLGLRLAGALERFWFTRGSLTEGREWLERFLNRDSASDVAPAVRAQAFSAAGLLANTQGAHRQATRWLEQGLASYHAAGDLVGAVRALTTLGGVAYDQGDLSGAVERWEQSLARARTMGDLGEVARALGNIGEALYHLGDLDGALARHTEALALARQLGRTNLEAFQLGDLGNVARRQGDLARATQLHRQALELKVALGAPRQIAITLEDLAGVAGAAGLGVRAARLLGAASVLREAIGTPQVVPERLATEQAVAAARAALGEAGWAAAFAAGRALAVEQAVAEALE